MYHLWGMRCPLSAWGVAVRTNRPLRNGGIMRYVIIGSGVAGIAAIEAIRSVDKAGEITLVGDDPYGFYSRPGLAYYLTGELHDKALFPRTAEEFQQFKFH